VGCRTRYGNLALEELYDEILGRIVPDRTDDIATLTGRCHPEQSRDATWPPVVRLTAAIRVQAVVSRSACRRSETRARRTHPSPVGL
jgi:hypothetical protein